MGEEHQLSKMQAKAAVKRRKNIILMNCSTDIGMQYLQNMLYL